MAYLKYSLPLVFALNGTPSFADASCEKQLLDDVSAFSLTLRGELNSVDRGIIDGACGHNFIGRIAGAVKTDVQNADHCLSMIDSWDFASGANLELLDDLQERVELAKRDQCVIGRSL